jgi:hypothetical protein
LEKIILVSTEDFVAEGVFHIAADLEFSGDTYYRLNAELWSNLPDSVTTRSYKYENTIITVKADWSDATDLTAKAYEVVRTSLENEKETGHFEWVGEYPSEITVPITITREGEGDSRYRHNRAFFVQNYLYDVFFILNLALPGSADLMNLSIREENKEIASKLELASFYPHSAYTSDEWPFLATLPVNQVEIWYSSIRSGVSQVPENSVERAIFAMLYICRSDGRAEDIIWLFYAFESLLQTRAGENFSALVDRFRFILQPEKKQESQMKKRLREMYDYRSSFVHGGLKVIHPLHNEQIDFRIDDSYTAIVNLTEYGIQLLLACIQHYIKNDWVDVQFRTIGQPIAISELDTLTPHFKQ